MRSARGGWGHNFKRAGVLRTRAHRTPGCGVGACADPAWEQPGARSRATNSQAGGARHNTQLREPVRARVRSRERCAGDGALCATRCYVEPVLGLPSTSAYPRPAQPRRGCAGALGPERAERDGAPATTSATDDERSSSCSRSRRRSLAHALPARARKARDRRVRACDVEPGDAAGSPAHAALARRVRIARGVSRAVRVG
jgi:hypothetical protein